MLHFDDPIGGTAITDSAAGSTVAKTFLNQAVIGSGQVWKGTGALDVYGAAVHPIFSGTASELLENSVLKELVVTDTLPVPEEKRFDGLEVLSVAELLGEAIHRIHSGLSVGAMFDHRGN